MSSPRFGAAKHIDKNIAQVNVSHIRGETAEAPWTTGTRAAGCTGEAGMSEAVIGGTLLFVGEYFVGLVDGFELRFGVFVAGVLIRMEFNGLAAIRRFNLVGSGRFSDA